MDEREAKIKRLEWILKEKDAEINHTRKIVWTLLHIIGSGKEVKEDIDEAFALFGER